jgi:cytochrome c2
MPELGPGEYARLGQDRAAARCGSREEGDAHTGVGDPERGRRAIQQYGCTACHRIPGIVGPASHTGPALTAMGSRKYIAGMLPNSYDNMVRWLRSPQSVSPQSAMPDMGVSAADAGDIAAYLAQLR